ncbi:MAG TPA: chromosome partitioning protein ParB [Firmicutes bacterium]|nr:chromosome partitioning protein ParB [Bacillota bacterium]HBK67287.1 chromosome partitioning protein ParB [Bacillota bacterium]HBT15492.1 chromosome partitioning protein ParB [Bacillota bacterium]
MNRTRALGKGLGALIPQLEEADLQNTLEVPVEKIEINPYQPRRSFDRESLTELSESIKIHGVLQPLLVRKSADHYQLIAGERRLRASKLAGLDTVPVVIKDLDDRAVMEIALVENLQREDLNPIEEAEAYKKLIEEFKLTQEEVAKSVGKSRSSITNTLRLLNLPTEIQQLVLNETITMGHARALLGLDLPEKQIHLSKKIIEENLSVRDTEELIRLMNISDVPRETLEGEKKKEVVYPRLPTLDPNLQAIVDDMTRLFGTKVRIKNSGKRGKIEIEYYSQEELERITEILLSL